MTAAQRKAIKTHRTRLRKRGLKRVEVTVREQDVELIRGAAAALRRDGSADRRLRTTIRDAVDKPQGVSAWDVFNSGPDVSSPDFDAVFEEINRFRHDPIMMQIRDHET